VIGRFPTPNDALLARLLLAAGLVNFGLAIAFLGLWLRLAQQGEFWRADFTAFYTGWTIVRDGEGARLYDLDLQARVQRGILDDRRFADDLLPFDYPPPAAILFAPLALLPRSSAFWVWTGAQALLLLWMSRLLLSIARRWSPQERWSMMSAVLAFPPLLFTFQLGAFSLLMVVCVLQAHLALKSSREPRAGLWLAIGALKPQAVLQPVWMLVGARRWRAVASLGYAGAGMIVLSSALLGWRTWPDFVRVIRTVSALFDANGIVPSEMYNLKGALTSLLGSQRGHLINLLSAIALLLASAATLSIWRRRESNDPSFDLRMALTILLGVLFSPHLYPQDSLMLVVPAALVYGYLRERDGSRRTFAAFAMSCPLLFAISDSIVGESAGIRPPTIVMAVLTVWAANLLANNEDRAPTPSLPWPASSRL
jgi:alpha-1,2-mannosyltransferase